MEFKKRVLNLIAYHLQVAESKMSGSKEDNKKRYYGVKVATLRDLYDDVKAMDERVNYYYGNNKHRN